MPESPPRPRVPRLRGSLLLALALALAVAGRALWIGHTRALHVVNALPAPVSLVLPGGEAREVPAGERVVIALGEGEHALTLRTPAGETPVTVRLSTGLWERFTRQPLFVLNVDGAAILLRQETVYGDVGLEPAPDAILTDPVLALDHVDYPFAPFPDEAPRQGLAVRVSWWRGSPTDVAATLPPGDPQALALLEGALRRDPADALSLRAWLQRVRDPARRREVLEAGLDRRPLLLPWHRSYQDTLREAGEHEALRARYDALLAAAPSDPDRLYLCGRLAPRAEDAAALYRRAVAVAPEHHAAWRGLAVLLAGQGRWDEAWDACQAAGDALDPDLDELRFQLRLARGELGPLTDEVQAARRERELDPNLLRRALELELQAGRIPQARQLQRAYAQAVRTRLPEDPQQLALLSQLWLDELTGDGAALLAAAADLADPARQAVFLLRGHALQGQLGRARALLGDAPDPWALLELAVAAVAHGEDAQPWIDEAMRTAQAGGPREQLLAGALRGEEPLDQVIGDALQRATLIAALASQRSEPGLRVRALALVQRPAYPASLIQRALAR